MEVLRIATAGSVDDGKSTLIGRLLYETNSITTDRLEAIHKASQRKGIDFVDLSLLTDGLIAEREQGITIDVAHIYFQTPKRKFIIADSPGHVEYTRNMITGASHADVSIILVDARLGILDQTHRHYYIAHLLRIPNVIVCVNKMDLIGYEEEKFRAIEKKFTEFAGQIKTADQHIQFIPISSLYGENITKRSEKMSWHKGNALLEILESLEAHPKESHARARFPVQYIIRPRTEAYHDFRGYAGRVASGKFKAGDSVTILPSQRTTTIDNIYQFETVVDEADTRQSVVITLTDDVDVSRGDMIVKTGEEPTQRKELNADICWMDNEPMNGSKTYLLQSGTSLSKAKIAAVEYIKIPSTLEQVAATSIRMNEIARVRIKTAKPVATDSYEENASNGSFILIDEYSNNTVAVGFVN
ncbi:MAG TPA: GTP-binding protein [Cyclobacteriaceae bacterium]|nr:GTP-binding protein [Cyclobacteriaceae bacterium]